MDSREAVGMHTLERGENQPLIVHRDVKWRRPARYDLVDMFFLMSIDRDLAIHGGFQAALLDLQRLIDGVPIGEDNWRANLAQVAQRVQRLREKSAREWIGEHSRAHPHHRRRVRAV